MQATLTWQGRGQARLCWMSVKVRSMNKLIRNMLQQIPQIYCVAHPRNLLNHVPDV